MIGLSLCVAAGHASAADSLCAPDETVFFNCRIKDSPKLLSVCGRTGVDASRGAALPGDYCNTVSARMTSCGLSLRPTRASPRQARCNARS